MGIYTDIISSGLCRKCLNEKYGSNLLPEDCQYFAFPELCPRCNKVNNIVVGIHPLKRWKLRFKKEKKCL